MYSEQEDLNIKILKELLQFLNIFLNEMAGTLPLLKEGDHAIEIKDGKKLLYRLLYNLSQIELMKLCHYLKNLL